MLLGTPHTLWGESSRDFCVRRWQTQTKLLYNLILKKNNNNSDQYDCKLKKWYSKWVWCWAMQRKAKINMILSVVSCVFTSLIFLDQNSNAQPRKTEKKLTMVYNWRTCKHSRWNIFSGFVNCNLNAGLIYVLNVN